MNQGIPKKAGFKLAVLVIALACLGRATGATAQTREFEMKAETGDTEKKTDPLYPKNPVVNAHRSILDSIRAGALADSGRRWRQQQEQFAPVKESGSQGWDAILLVLEIAMEVFCLCSESCNDGFYFADGATSPNDRVPGPGPG